MKKLEIHIHDFITLAFVLEYIQWQPKIIYI